MPTNPISELVSRLRKLLPVSWDNELDGHGEPTHANLTFGDHETQAMTLRPDDWMVLNELPDAIERLERENAELREQKLARLEDKWARWPNGDAGDAID